MTERSIKDGIKTLLTQNLDVEGLEIVLLERWNRTLSNSKGPSVVLWAAEGQETRFAGSGRSAGPVQGVKKVLWRIESTITSFGQSPEDYDNHEDLVAKILEIYRLNNTLGGYQAPVGSQVLNFGESQIPTNIPPTYVGQYMRYRTVVKTTCEEIYNA